VPSPFERRHREPPVRPIARFPRIYALIAQVRRHAFHWPPGAAKTGIFDICSDQSAQAREAVTAQTLTIDAIPSSMLTREDIMNKRFGQTLRQRLEHSHAPAESADREPMRSAPREAPRFRLPPTRAARSPRSRGGFLVGSPDRSRPPRSVIKALLAALAMAICGVALAVFASAPSIMSGAALTANPGPGMVASTSVAPSFVVPVKRR